jgi:hypothetical protein
VPFFEYSGNAIASEESVRITPSLRSQKGMIWAKDTASFEWWEVEIQFRVTGRGRVGADGLAFWYTQTKGFEGPVREEEMRKKDTSQDCKECKVVVFSYVRHAQHCKESLPDKRKQIP